MCFIFRALEGIKNPFSFPVHIHSRIDNGHRKMFVDVYRSPCEGAAAAHTLDLLHSGQTYCPFHQFDKQAPQKLKETMKRMLQEDVFNKLVQTGPDISKGKSSIWLNDVYGKRFRLLLDRL